MKDYFLLRNALEDLEAKSCGLRDYFECEGDSEQEMRRRVKSLMKEIVYVKKELEEIINEGL